MSGNDNASIEALMALAIRLLDSEASEGDSVLSIDSQLDLISDYTLKFQQLTESVDGGSSGNGGQLREVNPQKLRELLALHERVLKFAQSLEPQLEESFRTLRKRSQALRGYLGPLSVSSPNSKFKL